MKKKVLIVDANITVLQDYKRLLQSHDFEVFTAQNAAVALDICKRSDPHVILLDTNLSGESGFSVCQKIKTDDQFKNSVVLLMSDHPNQLEWKKHFFELGASSFLGKPIHTDILLTIIKSHFPDRPLWHDY